MEPATEDILDVFGDALRKPHFETPCLSVHEAEGHHLFVGEFVLDAAHDLAVEVLDDSRHSEHDRRTHFRYILPQVFEAARECDGRSAVAACEECGCALVRVMHREHREAYVLWLRLEHGLHEHRVEQEISVREHNALAYSCRS